MPSSFCATISSNPISRAMRSRCAMTSANSHWLSTCRHGYGKPAGWNALRDRCNSTEESLPIEYINTGFANAAAVSRRIAMASFSKASRTSSWLTVCTDTRTSHLGNI